MDLTLAYCGLNCSTCPIFLSSREKDKNRSQEMKVSIAKLCSEHYGMYMPLEEITECDGCRAGTGRLFSRCRICGIRNCADRRNLESCAECSDYACDNLLDIFIDDPGARVRLEQMRHTRSKMTQSTPNRELSSA